jgi:ribonuclease VapC
VALIVVDCSALLAILFDEPEKQAFEDAIGGAERCLISAVNAHEAATVLRVRSGRVAVERLWRLLTTNQIEMAPFDESQVRAASIAARAFTQRPASISATALPTRWPRA